MKKFYFLSFCFLILIKLCQAQQGQGKSISVNFQQATIEQVVTELEAKSGFHFFYNPMQFDSLKVTLQVTDKPIETILGQAFKNTGFSFAITKQQQVFLTKAREIQTGLAVGYFGITAANATAANMSVSPANADPDKDKKIPEATTENKLY